MKEMNSLVYCLCYIVSFMPEIKVYKMRWVILLLYTLLSISNHIQYLLLVTVFKEVEYYYGISRKEFNIVTPAVPFLFILFAIPSCYIGGKISFKMLILLGIVSNLTSAVIRWIGTQLAASFVMLLISNIFTGITQALILGMPPLIASIWFPTSERSLSTSLGVMASFAGILMAFMSYEIVHMFGCAIDTDTPSTSPITSNNTYVVKYRNKPTKSNLYHKCYVAFTALTLLQVILAAIPLLILFFTPTKPKIPPSITPGEVKFSLSELYTNIKKALKIRAFVAVLCAAGGTIGISCAYSGVMPQFLKTFQVSDDLTLFVMIAGVLLGMSVSVLLGNLLDIYHCYRSLWSFLLFTSAFMYILPNFLIGHSTLVATLSILLQALVLAQLPIIIEYACEIAYPLSSFVIGTLIMTSIGIGQIIGTAIIEYLLGNYPTVYDSIHCLNIGSVALLLSFIALLFINPPLARLNTELGNPTIYSIDESSINKSIDSN